MDAWDSIFGDTSKTTGTVRVKRPAGTTRTAKLATGPAGMGEDEYVAAAMAGTTFTEQAKAGDVTRTRKDVTGAAARSAVLSMLGVAVTADVPEPVKRRGRTVESANGAAQS